MDHREQFRTGESSRPQLGQPRASQATRASASAGRSLAGRQLPNAPASSPPASASTPASTITPALPSRRPARNNSRTHTEYRNRHPILCKFLLL
jgi:hypothetical protein